MPDSHSIAKSPMPAAQLNDDLPVYAPMANPNAAKLTPPSALWITDSTSLEHPHHFRKTYNTLSHGLDLVDADSLAYRLHPHENDHHHVTIETVTIP